MFFLGVDSGGSKIKGILVDPEGSLLRTSVGGAGNIAVLGEAKFKKNLLTVVHKLLAGESPSIVEHATFGIAGAGRPDEKRLAEQIIQEIGFTGFTVMTDSELLYYSFFGDGPGIVVESGTGSFCIFRTQSGELEQLGGWGYLLGDEGSGFVIGRDAMREVMHNHESPDSPSVLTQRLLAFYRVKGVGELISGVYASPEPQEYIASCAKLVCEAASNGDYAAEQIVESASNSLMEMAKQAQAYMGKEKYKIALAGGVLSQESLLRSKLVRNIRSSGLQVEFEDRALSPRAAALVYAIARAGMIAEPNLYAKLDEDPA